MVVLRAALFVGLVASLVAAQSTCSSYTTSQRCVNNGCKWCSSVSYGSGASSYGSCTSTLSSCSSSYYALTNPCASLLFSSSCTANPVCGWCSSSNTCMYNGWSSTDSTPCSTTITQGSCSSASDKISCYNRPQTCYWTGSSCSSTYQYSGSNDCDSYATYSSSCTLATSSSYNSGSCGWCSNAFGTGLGDCLYYTSSSPSQCSSSSSFTYNTGYNYNNNVAIAAAVGLAGTVLIIVIVAPLVICLCIIGCSVYFCCIRPRNQTTVVVAGGGAYAPMNQPGAYQQPPPMGYAPQPGYQAPQPGYQAQPGYQPQPGYAPDPSVYKSA